MPPAGRLVHLCGCRASAFVSVLKQFESFSQVLDVDPPQICTHTHTPRLSSAAPPLSPSHQTRKTPFT